MKKPKILIAEDKSYIADLIRRQLEEHDYNVPAIVNSGEDAVHRVSEIHPDLVIMDIKLNGHIDGITAAHKIQANEDIPIIYLTAHVNDDLLNRAKTTSPYGYILKPYKVQELYSAIEIALYKHTQEKKLIRSSYETRKKIEQTYNSQRIKSEEKLRQSEEKNADRLQRIIDHTIEAFASTIEFRDPYTSSHQKRTTLLACAIAREMGLSEETIKGIQVAGTLHDIGKIQVPSEILSKPSKLTDFEFSLLHRHCEVGYDILKSIEFPWPVAQIVFQHHERLDGSGYPQGLTEKDILLEAAILSVADVVEAMSSHRPYRPGFGIEKALAEILQNKGKLYNADAVDACVRLFKDKGFQFE